MFRGVLCCGGLCCALLFVVCCALRLLVVCCEYSVDDPGKHAWGQVPLLGAPVPPDPGKLRMGRLL